jgi:hypothetical protein
MAAPRRAKPYSRAFFAYQPNDYENTDKHDSDFKPKSSQDDKRKRPKKEEKRSEKKQNKHSLLVDRPPPEAYRRAQRLIYGGDDEEDEDDNEGSDFKVPAQKTPPPRQAARRSTYESDDESDELPDPKAHHKKPPPPSIQHKKAQSSNRKVDANLSKSASNLQLDQPKRLQKPIARAYRRDNKRVRESDESSTQDSDEDSGYIKSDESYRQESSEASDEDEKNYDRYKGTAFERAPSRKAAPRTKAGASVGLALRQQSVASTASTYTLRSHRIKRETSTSTSTNRSTPFLREKHSPSFGTAPGPLKGRSISEYTQVPWIDPVRRKSAMRVPGYIPPSNGHSNNIVEAFDSPSDLFAEDFGVFKTLSDDEKRAIIQHEAEEYGMEKPKGYSVSFHYNPHVEYHHFGSSHPMKPWRLTLTKQLVLSYGLEYCMDLYEPRPASFNELAMFHDKKYLSFLQK